MFHNNSVQKPVASQITLRMLSCVKIADTDIQEQKHWKQPTFCAGNAQAIFSIPRSHENLVLSVLEVPYNLGSKISKLKIKCKSNIYFRKLCTSLPAHWSNSVQSMASTCSSESLSSSWRGCHSTMDNIQTTHRVRSTCQWIQVA